jgi:hypothetical protein
MRYTVTTFKVCLEVCDVGDHTSIKANLRGKLAGNTRRYPRRLAMGFLSFFLPILKDIKSGHITGLIFSKLARPWPSRSINCTS